MTSFILGDSEYTFPSILQFYFCLEEFMQQESLSLRSSAPVGLTGFTIFFQSVVKSSFLSPIQNFCFNPSLRLFLQENMVQKAGGKNVGREGSLQKQSAGIKFRNMTCKFPSRPNMSCEPEGLEDSTWDLDKGHSCYELTVTIIDPYVNRVFPLSHILSHWIFQHGLSIFMPRKGVLETCPTSPLNNNTLNNSQSNANMQVLKTNLELQENS